MFKVGDLVRSSTTTNRYFLKDKKAIFIVVEVMHNSMHIVNLKAVHLKKSKRCIYKYYVYITDITHVEPIKTVSNNVVNPLYQAEALNYAQ